MLHQRYLIIIEHGQASGLSAHVPDLPGCVATGATQEQLERQMRDAIKFHIEGLREAGEPIPEPSGLTATYVDATT